MCLALADAALETAGLFTGLFVDVVAKFAYNFYLIFLVYFRSGNTCAKVILYRGLVTHVPK